MGFIGENYSYEDKRSFRYSLQDYMHETFRFGDFSGKRVLEIGCGAGIDSAEFARNGAIVTSTDFTERAVKSTRELLAEAGLPADVHQADATSLPFEDNFFDCVYSFGVLHHIPPIDDALAEIKRVLKPGGQLMVMLYHKDSLLYGYSIVYLHGIAGKELETLSMEELLARYSERKLDNPFTRVYTRKEAEQQFSCYFTDCTTEIRYNVIDLPEKRKVKIIVDDEYDLGWHLILKARKAL